MSVTIPSIIMGFRESLEAFLLIAIMLNYVGSLKDGSNIFRLRIFQGVFAAIILSVVLGVLLNYLSNQLSSLEAMTKVWESLASLVAILLVSFFIYWMINHGSNLVSETKDKVKNNLSPLGLFIISFVIVGREGVEVAIFTFAGKYLYSSVLIGILAGIALTLMIFFSLVKVNISLLFKITLAYLILQAGYLLGYAIHEGLSALKAYQMIDGNHPIFYQVFNLSDTAFSHSSGTIGIAIHVLFGWYSKPEWIQFVIQYLYSSLVFVYWYFHHQKQKEQLNQQKLASGVR